MHVCVSMFINFVGLLFYILVNPLVSTLILLVNCYDVVSLPYESLYYNFFYGVPQHHLCIFMSLSVSDRMFCYNSLAKIYIQF